MKKRDNSRSEHALPSANQSEDIHDVQFRNKDCEKGEKISVWWQVDIDSLSIVASLLFPQRVTLALACSKTAQPA